MDSPRTPDVYTDSAGATHTAHECRWRASEVYTGFDVCLVNPVAHYRESAHLQSTDPSLSPDQEER